MVDDPNADLIGKVYDDKHGRWRVVGSAFGGTAHGYDGEFVVVEPFPDGGEHAEVLAEFARLAAADHQHGERSRAIGDVAP